MRPSISENRRKAYYLGAGMMAVGGLLFFSVFVTGILRFGDFTDFTARSRSEGLRALLGMALMIAGQFVRSAAARGWAGSGVVLDPERAREDLEPYSRMAGGMVRDAMDEARIDLGRAPERVVMIRCRGCGKLNEEDSKFCQECGEKV